MGRGVHIHLNFSCCWTLKTRQQKQKLVLERRHQVLTYLTLQLKVSGKIIVVESFDVVFFFIYVFSSLENNSDEFDDLFAIPDQQQGSKALHRQPEPPKSKNNDDAAGTRKSDGGWSVSEFFNV